MSNKNRRPAALGAPEEPATNASSKNKKNKDKYDSDSDGPKMTKRERKERKERRKRERSEESDSGRSSQKKSRASESMGDGSASEGFEEPVMSYAEAPSAKSAKVVEISKPFSERINWSEATILYSLDGSLNSLKSNATVNGKVPLLIGDGVMPDMMTPALSQRMVSKLGLHSKRALQSAPEKASQPVHVIRDVQILGSHNGFPVTLRFEHPTFIASKDQACYLNSEGKPVDYLTYTMCPGESCKDVTVLSNKCDPEMVNVFSDYPTFTQHNLREGLKEAVSKDGIERWMVPHSAKARHPVIDIASSKMAKEGHLSKKQMKAYEKSNTLPPALLETSRDNPEYSFISKKLFDVYEPRVQRGMSNTSPMSDLAHPYALVSRVGGEQIEYKDTPSSNTRLDKSETWTNSKETFANRTSPEAKQNVMSTDYKAWVRVRVRFTESRDLSKQLDK